MIRVVNMIPAVLSGESSQDSEPNIAVNPANPTDIVGTAFTPAAGGSFAPIYVSTDGGLTWSLRNVVPGNGSVGTGDITVGFATTGGMLYAGTLNGTTGHLQIMRTSGFTSTTPMTVLVDRANEDQPWVVAGSVVVGGASVDRVFVGNNDFNQPGGRTATVDRSADAATAPAPAGFAPFQLEHRATAGQDGPPVRIALHPSGVVYAALHRWVTSSGSNVKMDVVVTRDDAWGTSAAPFSALVDSGDGVIGQRVARGRFIRFNDTMGQERLGADLAIAVDPTDANTVYIAWCDRVGGSAGTDWTIHVRRSTDAGQTWSADLRTITNAKNPALAVNSQPRVGFAYQQFTGTRWVTQLEVTDDGWASAATTMVLHTAPSNTPARAFFPYIGDYIRLLAVDDEFYGVFSGNNTPDAANFPSGVTYQRAANWTTQTLLSTDNVTPVPCSMDPFFFHWTEASNESETAGLSDGLLADKYHEIQEFEEHYAFSPADLDYQGFTADTVAARGRPTFAELKDEYANLWAEMAIRRDKLPEVDSIVERVVGHKETYRAVERLSSVPWFAIAIIHNLEAGGDFTRHLHNGDPLTRRTVHVPAGRPRSGNPPFTWEQSAVDALEYDGLTQITDWSAEHLAYLFENFNGWGYRLYHPHVKSPYLWSYSNHYTQGKYVGDGQWSETAVSRQCGAMVLLKRLHETGEIRLDRAALDLPLATPQPTSMPMTSDGLAPASSPMTWDALTQASIPMTSDGLAQDPIPITRDAVALATAGEMVLPYDHSIVPQETGYWCGPAATQVVLNSRGIYVAESDLARSIGTHTGGTDYVGLIERDLDRRVPQAGYLSVYLPNDPPSPSQRERLWRDLVGGINAGWGMIMNWVAPPWNYPRGVKGSISPRYGGGTVYHYVAAMGYDDTPGARAVWIADSGFWPFGYWCGFDQVAKLIPPKGYTYADAAVVRVAG